MHYCYVVQVGKYIKVGHSSNMEKRMEAISTHAPKAPRIICLFSFPSLHGARECEKHLHYCLRDFRLNGEWFDEKPVIKFLKRSGKVLFDDDVELPYGARSHMQSF